VRGIEASRNSLAGKQGSRDQGFTVIELVIVIFLIAILTSLAAPSFRAMLVNQGIRNAAFDLFAALEFTRSEAIKRSANVNLKSGPRTDSTWTSGWRVEDSSANVLRSWTVGTGFTVTEKVGGATTITFSKEGRMSVPASTPKLEIAPSTTLSGVTSKCIQVDLVGRPKTQSGACP